MESHELSVSCLVYTFILFYYTQRDGKHKKKSLYMPDDAHIRVKTL
jgi:hypothetical protein